MENTAIVTNLAIATTAYVRQAPVVKVAPDGGGTTEFIANQTLIRAEERPALAAHHPTAICTVTAISGPLGVGSYPTSAVVSVFTAQP
jgi:hypothetical protein